MTATQQFTLTLDKDLPNLKDIRDNFSAIVVAGNFLWLGGDEGTQIDRMTQDSSGNYGNHQRFELASLLPDLPLDEGKEIDIEGLDEDQGYLWLIGSHSKKRKKAEEGKSPEKNRERLGLVEPDPLRHTLARVPLANGEPVKKAGSLSVARLRNAPDGGEGDALRTPARRQRPSGSVLGDPEQRQRYRHRRACGLRTSDLRGPPRAGVARMGSGARIRVAGRWTGIAGDERRLEKTPSST